MSKIAVFASGNGSNFQALVDYERAYHASYHIALVVCDRREAYVIKRAKQNGIPVLFVSPNEYATKAEYEAVIVQKLVTEGIEWIVLAGYMRIVGSTLLNAYAGKIINLHPSLLPAFAGKDGIGDAFRYGVKVTGVTVHFVDEGVDTGPIIAQEVVPIADDDTLEDVKANVHACEHRLLPQIVQLLAAGKIVLKGRKVVIQSNNFQTEGWNT